jgi:hypothetical protein
MVAYWRQTKLADAMTKMRARIFFTVQETPSPGRLQG